MIFRITNPVLLTTDPMIGLFQRAYANWGLAKAEGVLKWLEGAIHDPHTGLFVGEEQGDFRALGLVLIPENHLFQVPQVMHLFVDGSARLRADLLKEIVGFVKDAGYNRVWAINQSGSDKAWERLVRGTGKLHPVGSICEVEFK